MSHESPRVTKWILVVAVLLTVALKFGPGWTLSIPTGPEANATSASVETDEANALSTAKIRDLRCGQRVAGRNPLREEFDPSPEPDRASWRLLKLRMGKENGDELDIELLRPLAWIHEVGAEPGATVFLDMIELGAFGDATVLSIEPCPEIAQGSGNVVTGRFIHSAGETIDVHIEGVAPIGCTANHPFWSADREEFVEAGELLEGERVLLHNGETKRVVQLLPRPGPEVVYNLEVHGEHVYEVTPDGVLVHNWYPGAKRQFNPFKGKSPQEIDKMLRAKGFRAVGPDPAAGRGAYFHPTTGRKYYVDPGSSGMRSV